MIVDVHCHLTYEPLIDNIDNVIRRAKDADVKFIICSGTDHDNNVKSLRLSEKYDMIKAGLGLYPINSLDLNDKEIDKELDFIEQNKDKIICLGEVGLDFKEDEKNHDIQKKNFVKVLNLAKKIDLPVLVHSRKAEKEAIEILELLKMKKVIMHCFSGKFKLIEKIVNNKWYFSIPAIITFSFHFQKLVEEVPLSYLLTETDAPFLSPIKGKVNEPANIKYGIEKIAEIKKLNSDEVEKVIFMNFQKLFLQ